jgi:hypothetical protein
MTLAVSNQPTQTAELRLRCSGIVDAAPNDVLGLRRKLRRSSSAVATSREGHRLPRSGREGPHRAIGPGTTDIEPATVEKKPGTIGSLTVISRRNLWHIHLLPNRSHALSRSSHRWLPSPVLAQGGGQFSRFQSRGSRRCPPPPEGKRTKGSTDDREPPHDDRKAGSPD